MEAIFVPSPTGTNAPLVRPNHAATPCSVSIAPCPYRERDCRRHQHAPTASIVMLRSTIACARRQPEFLGVAVPSGPAQQFGGYAAREVIAPNAHPLQVRQVAQQRWYLPRQPVVPQPQVGKFVSRSRSAGTGPVNSLSCRYRCSRLDRSPSSPGIGPLRSLSLRSSHVSSGSGVCGLASLADFAHNSASFGLWLSSVFRGKLLTWELDLQQVSSGPAPA